ncbi:MAG: Rieske (2Fe-2S) protein [Bacteroidota bacterium]
MKWVKVFESLDKAQDIFGVKSFVKLVIGKTEICLVKFENHIYAVSDICPHQYENLSKGQVTAYGEIVCPLHFYRFSLKTGSECLNRTKDLKTFRVRADQSGLFVYC